MLSMVLVSSNFKYSSGFDGYHGLHLQGQGGSLRVVRRYFVACLMPIRKGLLPHSVSSLVGEGGGRRGRGGKGGGGVRGEG
jgi:hypothetical protein